VWVRDEGRMLRDVTMRDVTGFHLIRELFHLQSCLLRVDVFLNDSRNASQALNVPHLLLDVWKIMFSHLGIVV
jgi:hypothetical protein